MTWPSPRTVPAAASAAGGAVLLVALLLLSSPAASAAMDFAPEPLRVNTYTDGAQVAMGLAVGPDDRAYAVWQDGRFVASSGGNAIFLAASPADARGRALGDEVRVSPPDTTVDQQLPAVAVGPDGVVHVVWQQRPRPNSHPTGSTFAVYYSRSRDGGLTWSDPLQLSQPNNRNNTRPSVAATPGDGAYVAWEMEDYPGTSVVLARVSTGSRAWIREDLSNASETWQSNGQVDLATERDGRLHAAWVSTGLDGGGNLVATQVFYELLGSPDATSALDRPVPVADASAGTINAGPALALTSRHGAWIAWAQYRGAPTIEGKVEVLADRVVSSQGGADIVAGEFSHGPRTEVAVAACGGPGDAVLVAVSGVDDPTGPPYFTQVCSEYGCFAVPQPVVPKGTAGAFNASIAADSLGNVYVGWDDLRDAYLTQRRNAPPGAPELLLPDTATHTDPPEFEWSFNDPDAASSQSGFEVQWSQDRALEAHQTSGPVVGSVGKAPRWQAPEPLPDGRWYWRVRTRDQLGLWSVWSGTGEFLLDRTPPNVTVAIDRGAQYTFSRTVVLTIVASDNLQSLEGTVMTFEVSNDPDFGNTSGSHEYPPAGNELPWSITPGEGIKVVFVRVTDASGLASTAVASILYNETIMLLHTPVPNAPSGADINVTCQVLRATALKAFLHYKVKGDKEYEKVAMKGNGTDLWAVIPKDKVTTKGVEYWIEVTSGPLTVTSPPTDPDKHPIEVAVFEPVNTYQAPIYSPILVVAGTTLILLGLFALWYFKLREKK